MEGRRARHDLVEPFEYIDPSGRRWPVPAGTEVDGASIPKPFWGLIGGPFEGRYRDASVVHDYWCKARRRPHNAVHRAFYDAMLTSGVGERRAWLMHQAVEAFGPSWDAPRIDPRCEIVDENYDFTLCARNARPSAVRRREADRKALQSFADRVAGQVDPDDLKVLQDIARSEAR